MHIYLMCKGFIFKVEGIVIFVHWNVFFLKYSLRGKEKQFCSSSSAKPNFGLSHIVIK